MQSIQYIILPEQKIILIHCNGSIFLEDLIEHLKDQHADKDFNPTFNFFIDLRDAKSGIKSDDIKTFVEYIKLKSALSARRAMALLTNSPVVTLFSLLFKNEAAGLPINIEVFSSVTGAMQHIGLKLKDRDVVENAINELRNRIAEYSH